MSDANRMLAGLLAVGVGLMSCGKSDGDSGSGSDTGGASSGTSAGGTDATSGSGTSGTSMTGGGSASGGSGTTTGCPPCVPPPSPDCVGQGPCGCGPYDCPGDTDTDGGPSPCTAQDYDVPGCGINPGEGEYGWNGTTCEWLDPGCGCTGADCGALFPTFEACEQAYADCLPLDCTDDPMSCPAGYLCACGGPGPGPHPCKCGLACGDNSACPDPAQSTCCPGIVDGQSACTDDCTCFCE